MLFMKPSVFLPLSFGYETNPSGGIPGIQSAAPITAPYNQLTYTNFFAVQQTGLASLIIHPNGNEAAVGNIRSTLTSVYAGSPVASFQPLSAYFGCVLNPDSAVSPAVSCTVRVTAYTPDGTQYGETA